MAPRKQKGKPVVISLIDSDSDSNSDEPEKNNGKPGRAKSRERPSLGPLALKASTKSPTRKSQSLNKSNRLSGLTELTGSNALERTSGIGSCSTTECGSTIPGSTIPGGCDLEVPETVEDLATNKKKVAQVKDWLERHPPAPQQCYGSRVLVITGPPGSCKTTTAKVLASSFGFKVMEWKPPSQTEWSEYLYLGREAGQYISKMDAFESFLKRSNFPMLQLQSQKSHSEESADCGKLILIEDIPDPHNADSEERLIGLLTNMAKNVRHPTLCIFTESDADRGKRQLMQKKMIDALESQGVEHIEFNKVAITYMVKTLKKTAESKGWSIADSVIKQICATADGDLRNAMAILEMSMAGGGKELAGNRKTGNTKRVRKGDLKPAVELPCVGPEPQLSIFHALGKVLYNKKEENGEENSKRPSKTSKRKGSGGGSSRCDIPPSTPMFDAERIIIESGLDASTLCAFLREHYLSFIPCDGMSQAVQMASYLSKADSLASTFQPGDEPPITLGSGKEAAIPFHQLAASSIAIQGAMVSNPEPSPPSNLYQFHAPLMSTINQACKENGQELGRVVQRCACQYGGSIPLSVDTFARDVLPFFRHLEYWWSIKGGGRLAHGVPAVWASVQNGRIVRHGDIGSAPPDLNAVIVDKAQKGVDDTDPIEEW